MKRAVWGYSVAIFLVCGIILFISAGCETVKGMAKGMGRDIKNTDEWLRNNAW